MKQFCQIAQKLIYPSSAVRTWLHSLINRYIKSHSRQHFALPYWIYLRILFNFSDIITVVIVLALRDVTHRLEIFVATTMNNITYEYLKGVRGRGRERERGQQEALSRNFTSSPAYLQQDD